MPIPAESTNGKMRENNVTNNSINNDITQVPLTTLKTPHKYPHTLTVAVFCGDSCYFDANTHLRPLLLEAARGISCDNNNNSDSNNLSCSVFDSIQFDLDVTVFRDRPPGLLSHVDLIIFVFSPCHPLSFWQIKDLWLPLVAHLRGAVLAIMATNVDLCGNPTVADYWKRRCAVGSMSPCENTFDGPPSAHLMPPVFHSSLDIIPSAPKSVAVYFQEHPISHIDHRAHDIQPRSLDASPLTMDITEDSAARSSSPYTWNNSLALGSFVNDREMLTSPDSAHTEFAGGLDDMLVDSSYSSTRRVSGIITRPMLHFIYRKYMSNVNVSIFATAEEDDDDTDNMIYKAHVNIYTVFLERLRRVQLESVLTIACAGSTAPSQWLKGVPYLVSNLRYIFLLLALCRNGQLPMEGGWSELINDILIVTEKKGKDASDNSLITQGHQMTILESSPHNSLDVAITSQKPLPVKSGGFVTQLLNFINPELSNRGLCCDDRWDRVVNDAKEFYGLRMELAKDKSELGLFTEWKRETIDTFLSKLDENGALMSGLRSEYPSDVIDFLPRCSGLSVYGNRKTGEIVVGTRPICLTNCSEGDVFVDDVDKLYDSSYSTALCLQKAKELRQKEERKASKEISVIEEEERKLMKECRFLKDKIEAAEKFYAERNQVKMEIELIQSQITTYNENSIVEKQTYDAKINAAIDLIRKLEEETLAHEERERQLVVRPDHELKNVVDTADKDIMQTLGGLTFGEQKVVLAKIFVSAWTEKRLLKKEETDIDVFLCGMNGEDLEESVGGTTQSSCYQKKSGCYKYKTTEEMNDEEKVNFCLYGIVSEHHSPKLPADIIIDRSGDGTYETTSSVSRSTIAAMKIYQLPSTMGEYPTDSPTVRSNIDKIRHLDFKISSQQLRQEELWSCEIRPLLQWRLALGVNGPIVGYTAKLPVVSDNLPIRSLNANDQLDSKCESERNIPMSSVVSDHVIKRIRHVSPWNFDRKDIIPSNIGGLCDTGQQPLSYHDYMAESAEKLQNTIREVEAFAVLADDSDDIPTNDLESKWLLSILHERTEATLTEKNKVKLRKGASGEATRCLKSHRSPLPLVIDLDSDGDYSNYEFSDQREDHCSFVENDVSSKMSKLLFQNQMQRLHIEIEAHMCLWKTTSNDWGLVRTFLSVILNASAKEIYDGFLCEMWKTTERLQLIGL